MRSENFVESYILVVEEELKSLRIAIAMMKDKMHYKKMELKNLRSLRSERLVKLNDEKKHDLIQWLMYLMSEVHIDNEYMGPK